MVQESKWTGQNKWVQIDRSKYTGPKRWVQEIGSNLHIYFFSKHGYVTKTEISPNLKCHQN